MTEASMDMNELIAFALAEQVAESKKADLWRCSGKAAADLTREHELRAERFGQIAEALRESMWWGAQR
jgi:hypothetical protein